MATAIIGAESVPTNTDPLNPADWLSDFLAFGGRIEVSSDSISFGWGFDRNTPDLMELISEVQQSGNKAIVRAHVRSFFDAQAR